MSMRLVSVAFAAFLALPTAHAAAATGTCRFQGVSVYESITGSRSETVHGELSAAGGDLQATVTCTIRVDSQTVATVWTDGGGRSERVSFTAGITQYVELCGTIQTPYGTNSNCEDMRSTAAPPPETADLIDAFGDALLSPADPLACPVLASLPSVPGAVDIGPDGDLWIAGALVHDCPPYDPSSVPPFQIRVTYWDATVTVSV